MRLKDAITKRFFELLEEKKISMNKVAKKSDINHNLIVRSVNNNKKYSTEVVNAMAYGLDMTIREFFDDPIFDNIEKEE
jgi:transcriptional regulator with XRE-family HTH domain